MKWLVGGMYCLTIMNEDFLVIYVCAVICVPKYASVASVKTTTRSLCSFDNCTTCTKKSCLHNTLVHFCFDLSFLVYTKLLFVSKTCTFIETINVLNFFLLFIG